LCPLWDAPHHLRDWYLRTFVRTVLAGIDNTYQLLKLIQATQEKPRLFVVGFYCILIDAKWFFVDTLLHFKKGLFGQEEFIHISA